MLSGLMKPARCIVWIGTVFAVLEQVDVDPRTGLITSTAVAGDATWKLAEDEHTRPDQTPFDWRSPDVWPLH